MFASHGHRSLAAVAGKVGGTQIPRRFGLVLIRSANRALDSRCSLVHPHCSVHPFEVGDLGWVADAPQVPSGHRL
jgi:hypothetical protein